MFDLKSCARNAEAGRLQDWVLEYLASGYWANPGLHDGLLLQRRYWIGPIEVELSRLERCCGPEANMAFKVPIDIWEKRTSDIAVNLTDAESLPPLIVEWQFGHLIIRDGNHRFGAMMLKAWKSCFIVIWCNSEQERQVALSSLATSQFVR